VYYRVVVREAGVRNVASLHPSFLACSRLASEPKQGPADRDRRNLDNLTFQVQDFTE
jgi:hypothetical protein